MRILLVEVHVKADMIDRYLEVIRHDAEHSEQDEPGCLRFDVLRDTEDTNKFYYYEVYRDDAALQSHRESPHFRAYAEQVGDLLDAEVVRHFVQNQLPADGDWR